MRIYLEQIAKEALGVPKNQIETAQSVYGKLLQSLRQTLDNNEVLASKVLMTQRDSYEINFKLQGPFNIGDYNFDTVDMTLEAIVIPTDPSKRIDPTYAGASYTLPNPEVSGDKSRVKFIGDRNTVTLNLKYLINQGDTWEDVYNAMSEVLGKESIRTLSHEWTHEFQHQKLGLKDNQKIQDIGGPEENMANVLSGIFVKKFAKKFPKYKKMMYGKN